MVNRQGKYLSRRRHWLLAVGLACLTLAVTARANVTARLDRSDITQGETVTLILESDNPKESLQGDFSPLDKDFEVLDQRSETQMAINNGRQSATVRLLITLEPRHTGQLTVPALSLPDATTRPLSLKVSPAAPLKPGELPPVFVELAVDPQEGPYYVHAQISLTVRIFYQQNLTEAAISPPSPDQATVRLLDEVPYQADRNGHQYRVLERRYAIFPERSGELDVPPMKLSGRLIERPTDRLWQPDVRGRRIQVQSDPLTLTISPKPADYKGKFWLPARNLTLAQQITDADNLHVGEPVTRTIIIDAEGLEENMLEEPAWPDLEHVRIYPDQPQGISRDNGHWVLGHKEFRYAVVPEQAGALKLPAIQLHWWDTVQNRERVASLPAQNLTVQASPLNLETRPTAAPPADSSVAGPGTPGGSAPVPWASRWPMLTALFAVLWLITLGLLIRRGRLAQEAPVTPEETDEAALLAGFRRACHKGDAAGARQALSSWMRRFGPPYAHGSLMQFAQAVPDAGLARAIIDFDARSFSGETADDWRGQELWRAFEKWRAAADKHTQSASADTPDLYARAR